MLKLYRLSADAKDYWETWEDARGNHTVHWGALGTRGESKAVRGAGARESIQAEIDSLLLKGYRPIASDEHAILMIEYVVTGMGSPADIEKRHRLQDRMNQTLGWAGLGACDGGSIGGGTMEVCNFVVDFELAKSVIERDLAGTEFADYSRIYDERAD